MNELSDIVDKLYNKYGTDLHWEVLKAEKADSGNWVLLVRKTEVKESEGAKNDNNE